MCHKSIFRAPDYLAGKYKCSQNMIFGFDKGKL